MRKKSAFNRRKLFPIIGVLLAIAACCAGYLFVTPTETPIEKTMTGMLLYENGAAKQVEVQLNGTLSVYYFGNDDTTLTADLTVDGQPVAEDFTVIFDGDYGTSTAEVVCTAYYQLAAAVTVGGEACLLVAPAEAAENAEALLADLLPHADPSWNWNRT